jgi:hypothetical protein
MDAGAAMRVVRKARPGAIEMPSQEIFVRDFAGWLAERSARRDREKRRRA